MTCPLQHGILNVSLFFYLNTLAIAIHICGQTLWSAVRCNRWLFVRFLAAFSTSDFRAFAGLQICRTQADEIQLAAHRFMYEQLVQ